MPTGAGQGVQVMVPDQTRSFDPNAILGASAIPGTAGLPAGFNPEAAYGNVTSETLAYVQRARTAELTRAGINLATGLIGYDLATPAAVVQPVFTPVVNMIPRFAGVGIDFHRFKSITGFGWQAMNGGIPGVVDENATPAEPTYTVQTLFAAFQTIGAGNTVSFKSLWRGRQLDGDILSKRTAELVFILKLIEEQWLIYYSDYLWNVPAPLDPTTAATGGTVAAGTYWIGITAFNANGESGMTKSLNPVVTTGTTSTISVTFFTEPLATGYHVYLGATQGGTFFRQPAGNFAVPAGAEPSQVVPNLFGSASFTLSAATLSGTAAPVANSAMVAKGADTNPLTFNGIMALIFGAGNAAYAAAGSAPSVTALSAAGLRGAAANDTTYLGINTMNPQIMQPLGTNGKLAYTDLTTLLQIMFRNSRADPDFLWVSPQDMQTVTNLLINAGGTRLVVNTAVPDSLGNLTLGQRVTQMLNPITGKIIRVEVVPFQPQGTVIFGSRTLPYPVPGFDGPIIRVLTNREYYALDYPPTKQNPAFSFANYVDETLVLNFLGGWGVITGIIPG